MCGIVGSVGLGKHGRAVTAETLSTMRDRMAHRGPDGAGLWQSPDGRVCLGHRRLAILDLTDLASQPMPNEDGSLWITFNGEIYNHAEIRQELLRLGGHTWRTHHSDTEVILHAFEQWGIDCLHRFRGMFAFALWDARAQELWLVRDRLGVKPLYWSVVGDHLNFGSEIKALLADPEQTRQVNEEAFFHYLSFLVPPAPETLFAGIQKLGPGRWMRVRQDGSVQEHRYWDPLDFAETDYGVSDAEWSERVLAELRTSVQLRKVSDVPVGVFLSGGIDSSTNAKLFSEGEGSPVKTFTIGYDADYASYPNETPYARKVAEWVGADHHELLLGVEDLIEFLPRMIELQDEPIADPVCVPVYYVSKLARDHGVVVCQVGEGADELFCGYNSWKAMIRLAELNDLPVPGLVKAAGLGLLDLSGRRDGAPRERLRRGRVGQPVFWGGAEAFTQPEKEALLSPRLRQKFAGRTSWEAIEPIYKDFQNKACERSHLNWMTYVDLNLRLPELLLMRVDKMSMGVSLEGRVPFLDYKLVELALSIPAAVKHRDRELKAVLKRAVRGLIPDEILARKKQGFGVPVVEWFLDRLGEEAKRTLADFCDRTDFLSRDAVMRLFDQGRGQHAWYLLNFALWHEHAIERRR